MGKDKVKPLPVQDMISLKGIQADDFLEKAAPWIGRVVQAFNSLEGELVEMICRMFDGRGDRIGLAVVSGMMYRKKCDLYKRLILEFEERTGPTANRTLLFQRLARSGDKRNNVVHLDWESGDKAGFALGKVLVVQNKKEEGLRCNQVEMSIEELKRIRRYIVDTMKLLWQYGDTVECNR